MRRWNSGEQSQDTSRLLDPESGAAPRQSFGLEDSVLLREDKQNRKRWWKRGILVAAGVVMVLTTVMIIYYLLPSLSTVEYRVIIDAGSGGSRAHIYQYGGSSSLKAENVVKAAKLQPGLHTFVGGNYKDDDGKRVKWVDQKKKMNDYLKKLLESVKESIPERYWSKTSVQLLATEGMRSHQRKSPSRANCIMNAVRVVLKRECKAVGFEFIRAEIIYGKLEALGSWIDANIHYAQPDGEQVGVIEMGGFSLQIIQKKPNLGLCMHGYGTVAAKEKLDAKLKETGETLCLDTVKKYLLPSTKADELEEMDKNNSLAVSLDESNMDRLHQEVFAVRSGRIPFKLVGAFQYTGETARIAMGEPGYFQKLREIHLDDPTLKVFGEVGVRDGVDLGERQRFQAYFHLALYDLLGHVMEEQGTTIEDVQWSRGVAAMQDFDLDEDMELDEKELGRLIRKIRKEATKV